MFPGLESFQTDRARTTSLGMEDSSALYPSADVADGEQRSQELRVVTNWFEELKRQVQ